MKRPLFCLCVAFALGEAMYMYTDGAIYGAVLAALIFGAVYFTLRKRKIGVYVFSAGLLLGVLHAFCFVPEQEPFSSGDAVSFVGTVEDAQEDGKMVVSVIPSCDLQGIGAGEGEKVAESVRVVLVESKIDGAVNMGDVISVEGTFSTYQSKRNPGGFDQRRYYESLNICGYLYGAGVRVRRDATLGWLARGYYRVKQMLYAVRRAWKQRFYRLTDEKHAGILTGILLGDRQALDRSVKKLYRQVNLGHLLVVSGLHLSLIAGLFYKLLRRTGLSFGVSGGVAMVFVISYGVMTGANLSTLRAMVMLAVSMLAEVTGECYDMATSMGLALCLLILWNPLRLENSGVQLSFAAIAGVIFGRYVLRRLRMMPKVHRFKKRHRLLFSIMNRVVMALCINLVLAPVLAVTNYEIPTYGLLLNLVAIPLMTIVVICGVAGLAASYFSFSIGRFFLFPATCILKFYEFLGTVSLRLPCNFVHTGHVTKEQLMLYYGVLFLLAVSLKSRARAALRARVERMRGKKFQDGDWRKVLVFSVIILCLTAALGEFLLYRRDCNEQMVVLDVGQGQGVLIRTGDGVNLVIDGGSGSERELGEYTMVPALKYLHMNQVDYWFVSHDDIDHVSGLLDILEQGRACGITIKHLVFPSWARQMSTQDGEKLTRIRRLAEKQGISIVYMKAGDTLSGEDFSVTCLHPKEAGDGEGQGYSEKSGNDDSLALLYKSENFSALILGDMGTEALRHMLSYKGDLLKDAQYDVLVLPHHGSKYSLCPELYELCQGTAVISCGENNRYGHPHEEVLESLREHGLEIYRTDASGAVIVRGKDGEVRIAIDKS